MTNKINRSGVTFGDPVTVSFTLWWWGGGGGGRNWWTTRHQDRSDLDGFHLHTPLDRSLLIQPQIWVVPSPPHRDTRDVTTGFPGFISRASAKSDQMPWITCRPSWLIGFRAPTLIPRVRPTPDHSWTNVYDVAPTMSRRWTDVRRLRVMPCSGDQGISEITLALLLLMILSCHCDTRLRNYFSIDADVVQVYLTQSTSVCSAVQWLKLSTWKVGDRAFVSHSSNFKGTLTRSLIKIQIRRFCARPQTARARISNLVSGGQCHLIKSISWHIWHYLHRFYVHVI